VATVGDGEAELGEDVADVLVYGVVGDDKPGSDGVVVVSLCHQREHLAFAGRQGGDRVAPERGFDAVVIGEPQRAFYGNQFGLTFPLFEHYGVALWVPEVGGPIDPGSDAHDLVMALYGGMSKGERNRIRIRVRSAMAAQAATEGRYLAAGHPTATAWPTPVRTPTRPTPSMGGGCTNSNLVSQRQMSESITSSASLAFSDTILRRA
jgi:hypothetical protein